MSSILPPPKEPSDQKSIRLTKNQWGRVEEIAASGGNSLSDVVQHFVRWAFQELDRMTAGTPSREAEWLLERVSKPEADRLRAELQKALKSGKL